MIGFIDLCTVMFLTIVIFQDFHTRSIAKWLVIALPVLLIFRSVTTIGVKSFGTNLALNIGFMIFQLLCISLYFSFRNKKLVNIVDHYLGLGDIVFLFIICALFSPVNFLVYYIASIFFALFSFLIYRILTRKENTTIPLAGLMSVVLVGIFAMKYTFFDFDFQSDDQILKLLEPWMISIQ